MKKNCPPCCCWFTIKKLVPCVVQIYKIFHLAVNPQTRGGGGSQGRRDNEQRNKENTANEEQILTRTKQGKEVKPERKRMKREQDTHATEGKWTMLRTNASSLHDSLFSDERG